MKSWWQILLAGIFFGLLAAALVLLVSSPPRGKFVQLIPPPTPGPIIVNISGEIKNPGNYALEKGSRLADLVNKAGGLLETADTARINLAQYISDGQKVTIPVLQPISSSQPEVSSGGPTVEPEKAPSGPININTASQEELETLSGIGPSKAAAILKYRSANGPFQTIDDLDKVPGIGPATIEQFRDQVTVQ